MQDLFEKFRKAWGGCFPKLQKNGNFGTISSTSNDEAKEFCESPDLHLSFEPFALRDAGLPLFVGEAAGSASPLFKKRTYVVTDIKHPIFDAG